MADREFEILLYGATGFTGKLTALELARRGRRFAVAGRDRAKLESLRSRIEPRPEAIAVAVDDAEGLRRACARASVVLSCAGPFAVFGRPVQDAALAAGTHFIDVTGEQGYMLDTWRRNDEARAAGVVLLNAAGFDVVPTDLCAWLACRGIDAPEQVDIAFAASGGRLSHGTMKSILGILEAGCLCYEDGRWVTEPLGHHARDVPFPLPLGPRRVVSVPIGDAATAPRTTGARNVRVYVAAGRAIGRLLPLFGRAAPAIARGPVRRLLETLVDSSPEGPSDSERAATKFTIWSEALSREGHRQFATISGRDPYGFTAVASAYLAGKMAEPGYNRSGSLTPAQSVDALQFVDFLVAEGGLSVLSPQPPTTGW